jgi:phosphoglycerol geranylgeranyltransferase
MNSSRPVHRLGPGPVEKTLLASTKKSTRIAALIDPDSFNAAEASRIASTAEKTGVDTILVGGSTIGDQNHLDAVVLSIRKHITIPVILFPGNITGISRHANAILFSSLLNSTNTYFIIGAQAIGAFQIHKHSLETIPMGYLVFGEESTTSFVGQTRPIPYGKPMIAVMYALAAQYMGMRALYLEGGSGTGHPIPPGLVKSVKAYFKGILIVGGGITQPKTAVDLARAGADILVIGNLLETKNYTNKLRAIVDAVKGKT